MAEDSYIDVARQRRTVNKLKELIDKKADADSVASDVFLIKFNSLKNTADKTYQEILDAYNAGKYPLIMTDRNETFLLSYADSSQFRFTDYESWQSSPQNGSAVENVIQYDGSHTVLKVSNLNKWSVFTSSIKCWSGTADVFGAEQNYITLKDSAITTAKLADGSVTKAKLGSDVVIPENAAEVFMITVSDMTAEGTWNHDKTWSEINEAYLAGKILRVKYTEADEQYLDWCGYSNSCFYFANYDMHEKSNILIEIDPDDTAYVTRPSSLPVATASTLGGVKVGDGLSVTNDGTLSANASQAVLISPTSDILTTDEKTKIVDNWPNVILYYNNIYYYPNRVTTSSYSFSNFTVGSTAGVDPNKNIHLPRAEEIYTSGNRLITVDGSIDAASRLSYGVVKLSDEFELKKGKLTIANAMISTEKIKDNAVTADKIADGEITADKIANGAITADKLASGVGGEATIGSIYSMDYATPLSVILIPVGDYIMYLITFITTVDEVEMDIKAYRTAQSSSVLDTYPGGGSLSHHIYCRKDCVYTLPWFDVRPRSVSA
nr:MAG TPA: hypothetical protein [Caudoviricetes sp.]